MTQVLHLSTNQRATGGLYQILGSNGRAVIGGDIIDVSTTVQYKAGNIPPPLQVGSRPDNAAKCKDSQSAMRAAFRWLLFVIIVTAIAIYVSTTELPSVPKTVDELTLLATSHPASPPVPVEPAVIDSIAALWTHWSIILERVRPDALPIKTRGSAGAGTAGSPDLDNGARQPYTDYVSSTPADLYLLAESHAAFVEELNKEITGTELFSGTGVVVVGGGEYFGPAVVGLHMLRRSGSTLPVEMFVADMSEYNPMLCEEYLPKLGARCLILADYLAAGHPGLKVTHYQLKSLAILFSSFENVLLLDSDSMPLVDPEKELFASKSYVDTGFMVWPDFWTATESTQFWDIAGLESFPSNLPRTGSETGQMLLDKRRHLKTLLLAPYYNVYGPSYYYPLLSQGAMGEGDKETFMAAAVVLGAPYYRVPTPVKAQGRYTGRQEKGSAMVQFHPEDPHKPAFLHANTPKMNAGHLIDEGELFSYDKSTRLRLLGTRQEQVELFGEDLEEAVWQFLVQTGCELNNVIRDWGKRKRMCERLAEHYKSVFLLNEVKELPRVGRWNARKKGG